jgi:Spy/CpxP family protein refolding chaperone
MKRSPLLLLLLPLVAFAQQPSPDNDPIAKYLIPPELVMAHGQEVGLTDAQSASIKGEIRKTQTKFLDLQWDMQEESGKLTQLLQQSPVDEAKVLERADKIMSLEREIKRAHLTLLIHLKNLLTPAQVAKLMALRGPR